jgi:hypothetical protein
MRMLRETERVRLDVRGTSIEGIVSVRGIDARAEGNGLLVRMQEPVAVVVRDAEGERTLPIPATDRARTQRMLLMAMPVAAFLVSRWAGGRRAKGG